MSPRIGLAMTRVRVEEKLIAQELDRRGLAWERIDDATHWSLDPDRADRRYDVVLDRTIGFGRSLATLRMLEARGERCINPAACVATCGDKLVTHLALVAAGIPCPETRVAFDPGSALVAAEELGYPVVLKPTVGSWGRLVARLNDRDAAEAVLEDRQVLGDWTQHTYYLQRLVRKPGRDIRLFVVGGEAICAIYRMSAHWITNTARGATTAVCPVDDELAALGRTCARAVGGEIVAVDVVEDEEGRRLVLEVNHGMEFRNSIAPTGVDIPARIVDHVLARAEEGVPC
ncbi:MAG: lysine biosynthesis protein LysX [Planctomycetota bacterium]